MQAAPHAANVASLVSLNDKWTITRGRVFLNGTQALARILLAQKYLDEQAGLNTAGYITGYRGSPLGNVDSTLWSISKLLDAASITFLPGVNEDIAATVVRGTQQINALPGALVDGVFAAWYGKGPGVDRSGDALKHGNFAGAHKNGGVLICYGDDHGGKSSTVAHHSEQAMAAALIPSLYPADVSEIIEYGLLGFAMSRYSGSWVGLKCVNEVVEQTLTASIDLDGFTTVSPAYGDLPPEGIHNRVGAFTPLRDEQLVTDYRLPLVLKFVRENRIDRTIFRSRKPALGLVAAGKSYADTRQALQLLGLDGDGAAKFGISLYKVGCIWPLEPQGITEFCAGHRTIFVIEEKKSFIELQAAAVLINLAERPLLIGKRDETGAPLFSASLQLEPVRIALAIVERLEHLGLRVGALRKAADRLMSQSNALPGANADMGRRSPFFCSGCPHSRSTRLPEGSVSMTGIGCHGMANFVRPQEALPGTHMGAEGGNWIGLAPYSGTNHIFQNMGDGTYYHSGLLAIRAAVASGVNITYKILYNDAVAMTGGQPVDGPISVATIAQQVRHEGVTAIILVSDKPELYRGNKELPSGIRVEHRDNLDAVQRELRSVKGCSVLIYEQTCAAEKRRRRKRGLMPDPPKRLFISKSVCEGCGDCSVQSTCVSLMPVETDLGTKRMIDQSSCNKDFSCINGFCPSFITVHGAEPRKPAAAKLDQSLFADLPPPSAVKVVGDSFNVMVAGVGGTGVITVAAIIGMAAHIEGQATSLFDMTGLAQKNGAVFSHVKIASQPGSLHSQRLGRGEADVLIAFDIVAALADEANMTLSDGRTRALVNSDITPTAAFQFNRDLSIDTTLLLSRLNRTIGADNVSTVNATAIALALMGDTIAANMFLVGMALQKGLLPLSVDALEQAIALNGTAVQLNMNSLRLGRLCAADPARFELLLPKADIVPPQSLDSVTGRQSAHLSSYQDAAYARRFEVLVERVRCAEDAVSPGSVAMSLTVARNYARLLAYKDEYEVGRLLTSPELKKELAQTFEGGAKLSLNLAPPFLGGKPVNGRPRKRAFSAKWMLPVLTLLAKAKFLRGTFFDVFGYTAERRMERAAIGDYEALVEVVLSSLTAANLQAGVKLLSLVEMVRGYGPVKAGAMAAYEAALPASREAFHKIAAPQVVAA